MSLPPMRPWQSAKLLRNSILLIASETLSLTECHNQPTEAGVAAYGLNAAIVDSMCSQT
jgi:hypothetical protein